MQCKLHVRFGGRAGETHRSKDDRALRSDPYTYVPTRSGMAYVCFIVDAFSRVPQLVGRRVADFWRVSWGDAAFGARAACVHAPDGPV
jgi:hypothetical protein